MLLYNSSDLNTKIITMNILDSGHEAKVMKTLNDIYKQLFGSGN